MRVNTCELVAPKSRAAVIIDGFISDNFGKTISTTIGMLNAMCASNTDIKPSLNPTTVKRIKRLAPMITSGDTIKILLKPNNTCLRRFERM